MPDHPQWLQQFKHCWLGLSEHKWDELDQLYHLQLVFKDPTGTIKGRDNFKSHLAALYTASNSIDYQLGTPIVQDDNNAAQPWSMSFQHPKLNSGNPIEVEGISQLRAEQGQIIYHRDYFDMGQFIYESVPVVGSIIKLIKRRVSPS